MDYDPGDVSGQLGLECRLIRTWCRDTSKDNTPPKAMQTGAPGHEAKPGGYTGLLKVGSSCTLFPSHALPICTAVYEYTQDQAFLTTSLEMARSFINRLASSPSTIDGVPAWDFDAPPPTSADTSSASVAAAGFMYLADGLEQTQDATGAQFWRGQSLEVSA